MQTIRILDPLVPRPPGKVVVAPVKRLDGLRIAFVNNGWTSFTTIGQHLRGNLLASYGVAEVRGYDIPPSHEPPAGLLEAIAADCHAAIVGIGN